VGPADGRLFDVRERDRRAAVGDLREHRGRHQPVGSRVVADLAALVGAPALELAASDGARVVDFGGNGRRPRKNRNRGAHGNGIVRAVSHLAFVVLAPAPDIAARANCAELAVADGDGRPQPHRGHRRDSLNRLAH
jgi:hypothetical protein